MKRCCENCKKLTYECNGLHVYNFHLFSDNQDYCSKFEPIAKDKGIEKLKVLIGTDATFTIANKINEMSDNK
jgi:hypothetical protein